MQPVDRRIVRIVEPASHRHRNTQRRLCASSVLSRAMLAADDTVSSPLHGAAERGDEEQARELLAGGALVDERNGGGETPLHRACMCGHQALASALLEAGADAEASDADGMRPLHLAAMGSHDAVVALLLACGASHDAPARSGRLPLHWAALYNAAGACQLLVDVGADVGATDSGGKTAVQLAERKGHEAVLRALRQSADGAAAAPRADVAPQQPPPPLPQQLHDALLPSCPEPLQHEADDHGAVVLLLERELGNIQGLLQRLVDSSSATTCAPDPADSTSHSRGVSLECAAAMAVGAGMLGLALGWIAGATGRSRQ